MAQKKEFIFALGPSKICELFKTEISGGLLGEFVECLLYDFSESQAQYVVELLEALSTSQRFSLSLAFLSKKEKEFLSTLHEKLCCLEKTEETKGLLDRLTTLKGVYSL